MINKVTQFKLECGADIAIVLDLDDMFEKIRVKGFKIKEIQPQTLLLMTAPLTLKWQSDGMDVGVILVMDIPYFYTLMHKNHQTPSFSFSV